MRDVLYHFYTPNLYFFTELIDLSALAIDVKRTVFYLCLLLLVQSWYCIMPDYATILGLVWPNSQCCLA